ncbi:hypothetical protein GCM10009612_74630 [Streptomyces beijiangensis]
MGGGEQGVEDDRGVTAVGEGPGDVRADEARAAGDEYAHGLDGTGGRARRGGAAPIRHHYVRTLGMVIDITEGNTRSGRGPTGVPRDSSDTEQAVVSAGVQTGA